MKLGQNDEFMGPPLPPDWSPALPRQPLTIGITGGREMSWWEANKGWALPVGFILLFMAANR